MKSFLKVVGITLLAPVLVIAFTSYTFKGAWDVITAAVKDLNWAEMWNVSVLWITSLSWWWLAIIAAAMIIIASGFVTTEETEAKILDFFGYRYGMIEEGIGWIPPLVVNTTTVSTKQEEIEIGISALEKTTGGSTRRVFFEGKLFFRIAGAGSRDKKGLLALRYLDMDKTTRKERLAAIAEADIAQVAGANSGEILISHRGALALMLRCIFMLATPPHRQEGASDDPANWIDYYSPDKQEAILEELAKVENATSNSLAEKETGTAITGFLLTKISFSPNVEASMEEQARAKGKADAAKVTAKALKQMIEDLGVDGSNIPPEDQLQIAKVLHGVMAPTTKAVYEYDVKGIPQGLRDPHISIGGGGKPNQKGKKTS